MKNKFLLLASISAVILMNNPLKAMDTSFDDTIYHWSRSPDFSPQDRDFVLKNWKLRGSITKPGHRLPFAEKVFDFLDARRANMQDSEIDEQENTIYEELIGEISSLKQLDISLTEKILLARMREKKELAGLEFDAAEKFVLSGYVGNTTICTVEPIINYMLINAQRMNPSNALLFAETVYSLFDLTLQSEIPNFHSNRKKLIEIIASSNAKGVDLEVMADIFTHKYPSTLDEYVLGARLLRAVTLNPQKWIEKENWAILRSETLVPLAVHLWRKREFLADQELLSSARSIFPFLDIKDHTKVYQEVSEYLFASAYPATSNALNYLKKPE